MKRIIGMAFMLVIVSMFATGCYENRPNNSAESKEINATQQNQAGLLKTQPVPKVTCSLERQNLINRYHWLAGEALEWPCKTKTSYVYVFDHGLLLTNYTIKGKISSVSSMLTNGSQLVQRCGDLTPGYNEPEGRDYNCIDGAIDLAEADGSYGTNGNGKFFFTTDNRYVEVTESLSVIASDQPLDIPQPIAAVTVASAK